MVRMQIQFTEAELEALRREAAELRVSISAVVRDAVDRRIADAEPQPSREQLLQRSLAAMGRFRSGNGDVAAQHDAYFADSVLE